MHQRRKAIIGRARILGIGLMVLAALVLTGSAFGQDKKEKPPDTSSRAFKLSGYTQFLYNYWDKGTDSFSIPRARLTLSGELVKNIRFRIQIDGVKSPALIDANVTDAFGTPASVTVGSSTTLTASVLNEGNLPATSVQVSFTDGVAGSLLSHTVRRDINLLAIGFPVRVHLRPRLTLIRLTLIRKP